MSSAPAARNVLRILRHLGERAAPARASTIARDLDLPRSTVYHLLRELIEQGFVVHYPEYRTYGPSSLLGELSSAPRRAEQLTRLGTPLLERSVRLSSLPVVAHLSTLSGPDVIYLARVQTTRAPTTVTSVGVRLPAHLTATGRSMLARLSPSQVRALYPDRLSLILRNEAGPRTLADLTHLLAATRARGFAMENGEVVRDFASVGAAAVDASGYPAAAIGLTFRGPATEDAWNTLGAIVIDAAHELSTRLTGRPHTSLPFPS
ncbi:MULTISPECIES: IclR family transcriptional regulator [unclassified Salinibacterium]|uniref:IclR family transcriptional regulator n=1 Tax=unclassified Salinibacterium TaxID=2632331 RepID=UPI00141E6E03|nr:MULTISPECIES: IclR family transcriptional regulator [unclassified Salinibacterium]